MLSIPMSMSDLSVHPVTQLISMEYPSMLYKEAVLFLYCSAITVELMTNKKMFTFAHSFVLSLIRAFGSYGFVLPLVLGQLPNRAFESCDTYLWTLAGSMLYAGFFLAHMVPERFHKYPCVLHRVAYSVIRGNSLGHGFSMTVNLIPNSALAPFFGGFIAVNGHRFLEYGVAILAKDTVDTDVVFGVFGSCIYFVGVQYLKCPASVARAVLVLFHFFLECGYGDKLSEYVSEKATALKEKVTEKFGKVYAKLFKKAAAKYPAAKAPASKSMKRGRSKTPAKKK
ncbi:unnamed protein product [Amoebophrya sp. A120]|nr:unnamed protein product [Amoebophrya sp. A120]|eukprot:GSA120T00003132001.1